MSTTGGTPDRPAPSGGRQRNPEPLVESLATLLRAASIYQATHPRVVERAEVFAQKIAPWLEAPNWFAVRVRGDDVLVDRTVVPGKSQAVQWMVRRFREAGVAGVEFGAKVDAAAAIEFARALGSCNARIGRAFAAVWPPNHAKVRPLDLVFTGSHSGAPCEPGADAGTGTPAAAEVATTVGTAAQDVWKIGVVSRLSRSQQLIERLHALEHVCEQVAPSAGVETESIDIIASIVDLLPADVVNDPARVDQIVARALDQMQLGIARLLRDGAEIDDANLVRSALGVAKKYFGQSAGSLVTGTELPTGRPEDERITPDVGLLVAEIAELPKGSIGLPPGSECTAKAPALAYELCGIYLHLLATSPRPESLAALSECLPKTLDVLGRDAYPILDRYMERQTAAFVETNTDPARLQLLAFLERTGKADLAHARRYVDPDLLVRTFPESLPVAARLLRGPAGVEALRGVLTSVGATRLATGAETLRASGALHDPIVVEAIVAVGSGLVLPLMQRLAAADQPASHAAVVAYLRTQPLPPAESSVLRSLDAGELPARYLVDLCRLASTMVAPATASPAAKAAASAAASPFGSGLADAAAPSVASATAKPASKAGVKAGTAAADPAGTAAGKGAAAAATETRALPQTGQLLRMLAAREEGRFERRLIAIAGLLHVPGPETRALLQRLARTGRFTEWGPRPRRLRQQAREALRRLAKTDDKGEA